MTCLLRTLSVRPKGVPKPHRYTASMTVAGVVSFHCSGCWKRKP